MRPGGPDEVEMRLIDLDGRLGGIVGSVRQHIQLVLRSAEGKVASEGVVVDISEKLEHGWREVVAMKVLIRRFPPGWEGTPAWMQKHRQYARIMDQLATEISEQLGGAQSPPKGPGAGERGGGVKLETRDAAIEIRSSLAAAKRYTSPGTEWTVHRMDGMAPLPKGHGLSEEDIQAMFLALASASRGLLAHPMAAIQGDAEHKGRQGPIMVFAVAEQHEGEIEMEQEAQAQQGVSSAWTEIFNSHSSSSSSSYQPPMASPQRHDPPDPEAPARGKHASTQPIEKATGTPRELDAAHEPRMDAGAVESRAAAASRSSSSRSRGASASLRGHPGGRVLREGDAPAGRQAMSPGMLMREALRDVKQALEEERGQRDRAKRELEELAARAMSLEGEPQADAGLRARARWAPLPFGHDTNVFRVFSDH